MEDCILFIASDAHGNPRRGGDNGHFVVWSRDPDFTVINQMHDGGRLPDYDCFIACAQMMALRRGVQIDTRAFELEEGTSIPYGTILDQHHVDILSKHIPGGVRLVRGNPPRGGYIGNPAWGGKIVGDDAYLAASRGWMVVPNQPLGAQQASSTQQQQGTLTQENTMTQAQAFALAQSLVRIIWVAVLHKEPPTTPQTSGEALLDSTAQPIATALFAGDAAGVEREIVALLTAPEAEAERKEDLARDEPGH